MICTSMELTDLPSTMIMSSSSHVLASALFPARAAATNTSTSLVALLIVDRDAESHRTTKRSATGGERRNHAEEEAKPKKGEEREGGREAPCFSARPERSTVWSSHSPERDIKFSSLASFKRKLNL